jgi:hypothetical protein
MISGVRDNALALACRVEDRCRVQIRERQQVPLAFDEVYKEVQVI